MTIFGKTVSQYLSFQKYILMLIAIIGLARLFLSLGGVPDSTTKWLSISVVALIGLVYYSVRVHTTGFGSYKQLLPLIFFQSVVAQAIVIVGIVIAIYTNKDNVFSAPEYSGGSDGKTWLHVLAHLVFGIIIGPLIGWLIGSIILFIVKKVAPQGARSSASV
jgi:small basic protein